MLNCDIVDIMELPL
ncbi:hypothetical protein [Oribacterium sinus]